MNITMVIPTYWGRSKKDSWREGDAVYDHPTPIDGEDTLTRTLESIKILKNKNFKIVLLVCPTCDEIEDEAKKRTIDIVQNVGLEMGIYVFTPQNLRDIKQKLSEAGLSDRANSLLNIKGYANVRNICLHVAHILASDVAILIDDDEIFENPDWIDMSIEFIGKRIFGRSIYGMAGYYLNKFDEFYDDVEIEPWMTYFNRFGSKTKAFDKIIACEPRVKVTPFAFGGAMIIHKNMFNIVPFDPDVTRGEDVDYVINAKMFGFNFFLDNKLSIKHLPPKKDHPIWKRLREDIYRFLYEQAKLRAQYEVNNMTKVSAEEFDPYPGEFLKEDLKDKIYKTNVLLALEYLTEGNMDGCREAIRNIYLSEYEAIPKKDPFTEYRRRQKDWSELMDFSSDCRLKLRGVMETNNQRKVSYMIDRSRYDNISKNIIVENFKRFPELSNFTEESLDTLATITRMSAYNENEIIFKAGDIDPGLQFVVSGSVKIFQPVDKENDLVLATIEAGGVIGESFVVTSTNSVSGMACEFTELLTIKKNDLMDFIEKYPTIGNKLMLMLIDKLYQKLSNSNEQFKEKILQNEDLDMY